MSVARWLLLFATLLFMGMSASAYAAQRPHTALNKHAELLRGTWYSAEGEITFNANNTLIYKGKRYYCAIASGTIQLSKKRSTSMIPYRISDDKLILTVNGKETVYSRNR